MISIKEFQGLPPLAKDATISMGVFVPFWLVSIYIFGQHLYDKQEYVVIFSLAISLSILWLPITLIFGSAIAPKEYSKGSFLVGGGTVASILFVCGLICVFYDERKALGLHGFLIRTRNFTLCLVIGLIIIELINQSKNARQKPVKRAADNNPADKVDNSGND